MYRQIGRWMNTWIDRYINRYMRFITYMRSLRSIKVEELIYDQFIVLWSASGGAYLRAMGELIYEPWSLFMSLGAYL